MNSLESLEIQSLVQLLIAYTPRLLAALAALIVGWKLIRLFNMLFARHLNKRDFDPSLTSFFKSFFSFFLKTALLIGIVGLLGFETTSLVALLASAGLAVGLALQGTLSNFAGGALILMTRPFKVGDFISAQGFDGTVKEIQMIHTVLLTPDRKIILIPNGPLAGGSITNFSAESVRRCDMNFGVSYSDDIRLVKETLFELINQDARVLKDPPAQVVLKELGDSSVNFSVRAFVNAADFWPFFFEMQEKVKLLFDEKGISIPFPQRDVHLYHEEKTH